MNGLGSVPNDAIIAIFPWHRRNLTFNLIDSNGSEP